MITPQEFAAQWGNDLVRNTPASLENIRIPDISKQFLIEVGLPRWVERLEMNFDRFEDELPTLPDAFPNGYDFPSDYVRYRPIGADPIVLLCLDEYSNGSIHSIDIDGAGVPNSFVNSSVPQLAEFLLALKVVPTEGPPKVYTDEEADAFTEELERKFKRIDPEAMHNSGNYWPGYLESTLI